MQPAPEPEPELELELKPEPEPERARQPTDAGVEEAGCGPQHQQRQRQWLAPPVDTAADVQPEFADNYVEPTPQWVAPSPVPSRKQRSLDAARAFTASQEALHWDHVDTDKVRPHSAGSRRVDAGRSRLRSRPASASASAGRRTPCKLGAEGAPVERHDPRQIALKLKRVLQLMPRGGLTTDEWEQLFRHHSRTHALVDRQEFRVLLRRLGVPPLQVAEGELMALFSAVDADCDGKISGRQFAAAVARGGSGRQRRPRPQSAGPKLGGPRSGAEQSLAELVQPKAAWDRSSWTVRALALGAGIVCELGPELASPAAVAPAAAPAVACRGCAPMLLGRRTPSGACGHVGSRWQPNLPPSLLPTQCGDVFPGLRGCAARRRGQVYHGSSPCWWRPTPTLIPKRPQSRAGRAAQSASELRDADAGKWDAGGARGLAADKQTDRERRIRAVSRRHTEAYAAPRLCSDWLAAVCRQVG